jgi:predicted transposase YbfD/YdcC
VDLVGPVPGRAPAADPEALTVDDFAWDERTGRVDACPAGHRPMSCPHDAATTTRVEMPASTCAECPLRKQCPIEKTRDGKFILEFTDKERRLAGRRVEEKTEVFRERYASRSGIESTNSGLKNRLGLGRLPVRGRGSVFRVILHKVAGWNVLRAAASKTMRAWVSTQGQVDIKGAIITIDAMGTQKAIAAQIIEGEADYALALKGNQEALHQAVIDYIDEQLEGDLADAQEHVTTEVGHGREETRTYLQLPAPEDLPGFMLWKGLKSIGLVTSCCLRDGKETVEVRYYISSLEVDVKQFARAVRGHWSIENSCHWSLDMTFREDESRLRERHLRENFGWLNRFALSLLKQHPGRQSLVMKRRSCGWSDTFLMEVVTGSIC